MLGKPSWITPCGAAALLAFAPFAAAADQAPTLLTAEQKKAEALAAWQAADKAAAKGPADVKLIDQAVLKIPAHQLFIPKAEGARILRAMGNSSDDSFVGLIVDDNNDDHWAVSVDYNKEGYIKEDDAKTWNADDLLKTLKEGTQAGNADRRARGYPELDAIGWAEKPVYDPKAHQLVWALLVKQVGAAADDPVDINYNTYALGRDGYFSLDLLTNQKDLPMDRPVAKALLSDLTYNSGKAYSDFNGSTDNVAAYGLAALVGGVALKKLGILAVVLGFAAKFAKIIAILFFGGLAALGRIFGFRKKPKDPQSS